MNWVFSPKQIFVLTWWKNYKQAKGIICEGSVRSGKTVSLSISFVQWAMTNFEGYIFGLCGKTIASFKRNVWINLKTYLADMGFSYKENRDENRITITDAKGRSNIFFMFGGKDEGSQDLIQGITLAGVFLDEVALMPESFVSQATARCSVTGSKIWMNCNPSSPAHFIKKQYIDQYAEKGFIHMHFELADNYSLSEERKEFYRRQWSGVFYKRYILGQWCAAEGAIYEIFAEDHSRYLIDDDKIPKLRVITLGIDYGASQSRGAFMATGISMDGQVISLAEAHIEGVKSPDYIYEKAEAFYYYVCKLYKNFVRPNTMFCDYGALGQVLTLGLINHFRRKGLPIEVRDCLKGQIIDRIIFTLRKMGEGKYKITHHCPQLMQAFDSAVWEDGKEDVRLDDGSTDIDSLDAFEYACFPFCDKI